MAFAHPLNRRCPRGSRRNKKTGLCVPKGAPPTQPAITFGPPASKPPTAKKPTAKKPTAKKPTAKKPRCPRGTRRSKKTGECEPHGTAKTVKHSKAKTVKAQHSQVQHGEDRKEAQEELEDNKRVVDARFVCISC